LERIQEELLRKNDSLTQSTFGGGYDRTILEQQNSELNFNKQENTELRSRLTSETLKGQQNAHELDRQAIILEKCRR